LIATQALKTGSWALTFFFDQALWVSPDDPSRVWGVFGNFGISDGNPNPIRWSASVGMSGTSPISGRELDTFGVGYYFLVLQL
jgi:porin